MEHRRNLTSHYMSCRNTRRGVVSFYYGIHNKSVHRYAADTYMVLTSNTFSHIPVSALMMIMQYSHYDSNVLYYS